MELSNPFAPLTSIEPINVHLATTEIGARAFADIQSAGFATGDPDIDGWWESYFIEQALRNYVEPHQRFYIGWLGDAPVTSTLVFRNAGSEPRAYHSEPAACICGLAR